MTSTGGGGQIADFGYENGAGPLIGSPRVGCSPETGALWGASLRPGAVTPYSERVGRRWRQRDPRPQGVVTHYRAATGSQLDAPNLIGPAATR